MKKWKWKKKQKGREKRGRFFFLILSELFPNSYLKRLSLAVKGYSFNLVWKFAVNKLKLLW